jgi:phosphatidylserine decarboxylase
MIHREGYATIFLTILVIATLHLLTGHFGLGWTQPWLGILSAALLIIVLQFFRNPARPIATKDDHLLYAPADGKVVVIETVREGEYYNDERLMVSIFMSPLNVHVNRVPFSGKVAYRKYHPGKYLVAWHPKSSEENERMTVVIDGSHGSVLLRQIAGALARRIVNYLNPGEEVRQGQEMGFIKFGSRVDIFLPLDAKVLVEMGQVVRGNQDVIARL